MDDLLRDFVVETAEHLDVVDTELVRFERDPNNVAILALIFRLVHTVKGTCGFLGLPRLERLAHAAENVISMFRDGAPVTAKAVTTILTTIDRIKGIIGELERSGAEPEGADDDLVSALEALAAGTRPPASGIGMDPNHSLGNLTYQVLERPLRPGEVTLDDLERAFRDADGPELPSAAHNDQPSRGEEGSQMSQSVEDDTSQPAMASTAGEGEHDRGGSALAKQSVRVAVDTLDHLMTMVSELVLTRNQLLEIARQHDDAAFKGPLQRLSHITAELQDGVMKTRMQPIGSAWAKLPRIVRDLSRELGKRIDLETDGAETEIDRQLLELIKDPLVHMVRNAADHGIEKPDERAARGKPAHGVIRLRAAQEGGYILVEVSDDGRGIDVGKVRDKAVRQGLASETEIDRMSDAQVMRFVMEPGFSTAAAVTHVSGRGVGLDVVRSHVEQAGGVVDLRSRPGQGLTVVIKLPLTLAIASALIVEVAGQRFAIPQIAVAELVRAQAGSEVRMERLNGQLTLRLRQKLMPVLDLVDMLGLHTREDNAKASESRFVVICQVGGQRFGITVDGILHTEEIVVKPISAKLRHIAYYSGATILGDGSVIMILEPTGLARSVGDVATRDQRSAGASEEESEGARLERSLLLLFRAGGETLKAIPLSFIGRLEEFDRAAIESAGGNTVVQYQGKLMPIVGFEHGGFGGNANGRQPVLVFHQEERSIGLAVDEIVDVVDAAFQIDVSHASQGILGAAIIEGRSIEIVDVTSFVAPGADAFGKGMAQSNDVLLVESSEFFRALLTPVLQGAGYRVALAADQDSARRMLAHEDFGVIVLDLDQGDDQGFRFTEELRANLAGQSAPAIIGLSSKGGARLVQRGREAGLDDIVGKFDRQGLVAAVAECAGGGNMHYNLEAAA